MGIFTKKYKNVLSPVKTELPLLHEGGLFGIASIEMVTFINIICRLSCVSLEQCMHA